MARPAGSWDPTTVVPGFESLDHWVPMGDIIALQLGVRMLRMIKPQRKLRVVEIGSFVGTSTVALAEADPNLEIVCVDPWSGEGVARHTKEVYENHGGKSVLATFFANTAAYKIRVIRATSKEAAGSWNKNKKVDLVYIDGDHSYVGCRQDIDLWFPLMSDPGLMMGHDYTQSHPGVMQAAREVPMDGVLGYCTWFKWHVSRHPDTILEHESLL